MTVSIRSRVRQTGYGESGSVLPTYGDGIIKVHNTRRKPMMKSMPAIGNCSVYYDNAPFLKGALGYATASVFASGDKVAKP